MWKPSFRPKNIKLTPANPINKPNKVKERAT